MNFALAFHYALRSRRWEEVTPSTRIGIHLGEATEFTDADSDRTQLAGHAVDMAARMMSLAAGGQTVLTEAAFDSARQYVRRHPTVDGEAHPPDLVWLAHGRYVFKGREEPMQVFEVGAVGLAPLIAPADSEKARRADSLEELQMRGWRPSVGKEIPRRTGWRIERQLGEGGFGEVWLARHARTHQPRVFKFCFDADRLRSFKRELTLFRLIREVLGEREDIAPLLEVELESPP